jgi:hypothetical protein
MANGIFPITYNESTISGKGQNVPLNVDTRTAADYVAKGMSELGAAFNTVSERQDTVEVSTLQRQLDEMSFDYYQKYSQTGDEKTRKTLLENWGKQADGLQGSNARVNYAFGMHKENALNNWGQNFAKTELAIKQRNTDAADQINIDAALKNGDIDTVAKIYHNRVATNRMSPAQAEQSIKEAPNESVLIRMKYLVGAGDGVSAKQAIDLAGKHKPETLSEKQLGEYVQLVHHAQTSIDSISKDQKQARIDEAKAQIAVFKQQYRNYSPESKKQVTPNLLRMYIEAGGENPEAEETELLTWEKFDPAADLKKQAEENQKLANSEANKQLTDLMTKGQLSVPEIEARRNVLDDNNYIQWSKIAMNPPDKKGNPIQEAELKSLTMDIWRGKLSKDEFGKKALSYLADSNGINRTQYADAMLTINRELKPLRTAALSEADDRAGRALVDYKSEPELLAAFSSATGEEKKTLVDKRKLQFELLNQYNNEMLSWQDANPDKSGKEFEQFRDSKRFEYINRRVELEKTLKGEIENFGKQPNKPIRKPNETIADYLKRTGQK